MAYAPHAQVEGVTRQPLPFGLFSVVTFRPEGDSRWENGISYESANCAPARVIGAPECSPEGEYAAPGMPIEPQPDTASREELEAEPFSVYGWSACTPVGKTLDEIQTEAQNHLLSREESAVEAVLWGGAPGETAGLLEAGAVPMGTGYSLAAAVARLEGALATRYGSQGVIHMPREAALLAIAEDVLQVNGNRITTRLGTPVVAGTGYAAPAEGVATLYATPALIGYRTGIINDLTANGAGFDRATNDAEAVALRTYVLGLDGCTPPLSIEATLPGQPAAAPAPAPVED